MHSNLNDSFPHLRLCVAEICRLMIMGPGKKIIAAVFFPFLLSIANTAEASLTITGAVNKFSDFSIEYLYDKNNSMTIEEIDRITFGQEISSQFALGYRPGTAWFKITLLNQSENDRFVLYFTEPFWTELDLYRYEDGQWHVYKNGLAAPLQARDIQDANPSFPLQIASGQTITYYVRGTTVSSHIGEFQLYTEKEFYRVGRIKITDAFNSYSGILFFTMLLTGLLYFTMRQRLYLYYTAYVLSFLVWISTQSGVYIYLGAPGWKNALHAIGALMTLFMVLFSRELLRLKEHVPTIDKIFGLAAAIIFLCGLGIAIDMQQINLPFNIIASLFYMSLLVVAVKAWQQSYFNGAGYYLVALAVYMPGMVTMTLTYNGLISNHDVTRYTFAVGSFVEILFFSFILVNQFLEVKNQKIRVQNELLKEKDMRTQYLKDEVAKRISDLNEANKKLLKKTRDLEEIKEKLSIDAVTDPLSALSNRRYFLDNAILAFNEAKEAGQPLSLMMVDIDRFKGINDNFGHDAGDKAIVACADILKAHANETDIVSRYGGEEFVILLQNSTLGDALLRAERIRTDIEQHPVCFIDDKNIFLTVSIGLTQISPDEDQSIDDMLKRADKALYAAKDKGRNNVVNL
ncbi:MAG: sensor domain-containing diguanylate cyclase [Gammaproteobacteria bacterium]|nr:sensor domain-containing diguanylate cyclase [Gammaproteobacteria bacterium]